MSHPEDSLVIIYPASAIKIDSERTVGFEKYWGESSVKQKDQYIIRPKGQLCGQQKTQPKQKHDTEEGTWQQQEWQRHVEDERFEFFGVDVAALRPLTGVGSCEWDRKMTCFLDEKGRASAPAVLAKVLCDLRAIECNRTPSPHKIIGSVRQQIRDNRKLSVMKSALAACLKLEITICGLKSPRIYRCVVVPGDISLSGLAELIDVAFGWTTVTKETHQNHYKFVMPATRYRDNQLPRDPSCDVVFGPASFTTGNKRQGFLLWHKSRFCSEQ